jgi:GTP diphosphokinase / guanosine-3',5'-bis(diphosphate) 3'-diphosphatase
MYAYPNHAEVLALLREHMGSKEVEYVDEAYNLSKYAHRTQLRDGGERYFDHPKQVAIIIANVARVYDPEVLAMALLHDVVEDTFIVTRAGIARLFGRRVATGLDFLTKTGDHKKYVRKMYGCTDIGIIVVKLADRLQNICDMSGVTTGKRERKFAETRELYLQLADHFIAITDGADREALLTLRRMIADVVGC